MIPTLITVLLVKAGTPLTPSPRADDPLELIGNPTAAGFLTSCRTVFNTGTKKHVPEEDLPDVLESDFLGIDSIQSVQSMVTPPSSAFLPGWWEDAGWDSVLPDDMLEIYEAARRLIAKKVEERPGAYKDQAYFTVSFIGFWNIETSRDFESQTVDVDAVSFVGEGKAVLNL